MKIVYDFHPEPVEGFLDMLKLITLNVEKDRHWDRIIPLLERENADVVCMQELFPKDLEMLKKRFGYNATYLNIDDREEGIALLTTLPLTDMRHECYNANRGMIWGTVVKDGVPYTIGVTHFTWTPNGEPDDAQRRDAPALLRIIENIPELILCGDFNAPRGNNEIYQLFTKKLIDRIPKEITSTLDTNLHHAAKDPIEKTRLERFVVDYIFSTPEYSVENVRKVCGVSDHCAIVGVVASNSVVEENKYTI